MYRTLKKAGLGGFAGNEYWSSSQYYDDGYRYARRQGFDDGDQGMDFKGSKNRVRAVRAF